MERYAIASVERAHPQAVRRDCPHLRHLQERRHVAANVGDRPQRGRRLRAGQEVLALQLLAVARLELRTEVRQTLVPRPDHAHLRRTGRRVERGQRVYVGRGACRPVERRRGRRCVPARRDRLDPRLIETALAPVAEQTDAVPAGHDRFEVLLDLGQWQVLVHHLVHVEGRRDVEREPGDHAQPAECDHRAGEAIAVVSTGNRSDRAVRSDDVHSRHPRAEDAISTTRAVRRGCAGTGHCDVWQRGGVV